MSKRQITTTIILIAVLAGAAISIFIFVRQTAVPTFVAPPPPPPTEPVPTAPTPTEPTPIPPPTDFAPPPPPPPADQVVRCDGQEPEELTINCSKVTFPQPNTAKAAFISRADLTVDAFAATPLIGIMEGAYLAVDTNLASPAALAELQRVLVDQNAPVIILGGLNAVSNDVIKQINDAGFTNTRRIFGPRRHDTAVAIGEEVLVQVPIAYPGKTVRAIGFSEDTVLVDAYWAGPALSGRAAYTSPSLILLTERGSPVLNTSTQAFLDKLDPQKFVCNIFGGTSAVHEEIEKELKRQCAAVTRTGDVDRLWTNYRGLQRYYPAPSNVAVIANAYPGKNAGDNGYFSLQAAAASASVKGNPLLMIDHDFAHPSTFGQSLFLCSYNLVIDQAIVSGNLNDISAIGETGVQERIAGFIPPCNSVN